MLASSSLVEVLLLSRNMARDARRGPRFLVAVGMFTHSSLVEASLLRRNMDREICGGSISYGLMFSIPNKTHI